MMTTFLGRLSPVDEHLAALHSRGHDVRVVDGGTDKADVLERFRLGLGLPDWFGRNWDALVDCLRDLDGAGGRPLELVWDHVHALREREPATYETALQILQEAEAGRTDLRVTVIDR
jgi:RNAse (barnase) inhibitor barstar